MKIGQRIAVVLAFVAVLGVCTPAPSRGQASKKSSSTKAAAPVEIEEVTVVAQKREENIQEVPISITAISTEALSQHGVTDVFSLGQAVPNVHVSQQYGNDTSSAIAIRGVTQNLSQVSLQQAAGLYVDGVYIAHLFGSNLSLEDLERVEILRGPQGTLYGRNTIAGAMNLITAKPSEQRSITVQTDVGNYDAFHSRLTANLPLLGKNGLWQSEALGTLSLRQNVMYMSHDGYTENVSPTNVPASGSAALGTLRRYDTMTQLRWQPVKELTIDYAYEYHNHKGVTDAQQVVIVIPCRATSAGSFNLNPYLEPSRAKSSSASIQCVTPRQCKSLFGENQNRMHTLTAAYALGEIGALGDVTAKSISAYRSYNVNMSSDLDGSPLH